MGEPARHHEPDVVDMVEYLRETLREVDDAIADLTERRQGISVRLAVIEGANSDRVHEAVADFEDRAETGRPYEGEDAQSLLSEAHRRYGS